MGRLSVLSIAGWIHRAPCRTVAVFNIKTQVAGIIQSILVLVASSHGFGKSASLIQPNELDKAQQVRSLLLDSFLQFLTTGQSYYVSNIFYVLTLGLVKCSATCFVAKLTVKNMGSL